MDPDITVVTNIPAPKVIKLNHKYYCFYLTTNTIITIVIHVQDIDEGNVTLYYSTKQTKKCKCYRILHTTHTSKLYFAIDKKISKSYTKEKAT